MERGRYLVDTIGTCGNCHTPKDKRGRPIAAKRFAGGFVIKEEPFDAVAANITPDPETGIGKWTLAQTIRAIREGIRPDGTVIGPPMPIELYRRLSDRDVRAIAVYIRSVKPVRNKVAKSVYRMPLPKSYGPPVKSVPEPDRSNPVAYGRYLAGPLSGRSRGPLHRVSYAAGERPARLVENRRRRPSVPRAVGRQRSPEYHAAPDRWPRRLERCPDHPRHHTRHLQGRLAAHAADGLRMVCKDATQRSSRHRRLSAVAEAVADELIQ
jgi:cytochrome c553